METITSFKRDLKNYKSMELVECSIKDHKFLNIKRDIALVDTVQFALWTKRVNKQGVEEYFKSYMRYPKASDYKYNKDLDKFTISETYTNSQGTTTDFFTYLLYK